MFEITKTYAEGHQALVFYLNTPAFQHPDKTHNILQFLQEAHTPIVPTTGKWNLWYEADPQAPLAKDV